MGGKNSLQIFYFPYNIAPVVACDVIHERYILQAKHSQAPDVFIHKVDPPFHFCGTAV
jgi:hypothetical protein